ncbi:MAG: efflux RND transporter periplasmic adaptor subunit [Phycisphaerales bacterium JB061]
MQAMMVSVLAVTGLFAQPAVDLSELPPPETFGIKAVTRPSQDAIMGFSFPTSVMEIIVADGDEVKMGDPMVVADNREAHDAVVLQTIRAESTLDVDAERKALELAEVELEATKTAFEGGGGSTLELDRAELNAETAKLRLDASQQRLQEQQIQLSQLQARLDKHTVSAPFDGVVESVLVAVGDSVRESDPAVRVVSVDPLWVDVATPTSITLGLEDGDPAWCLVRIGDDASLLGATIVGISPVADSVTGARRVRVEVPNPGTLPAGLTAFVRFDEPGKEWAKLAATQATARAGQDIPGEEG